MHFPLFFSSLFTTEFTMADEQIKFKSASHTLLPSQRCNLGQISVSASDVGIVTLIAQSLASLNYFYLVCVFLHVYCGAWCQNPLASWEGAIIS